MTTVSNNTIELTDDELWKSALQAASYQEAYRQLSKIQNWSSLKGKAKMQLEKLPSTSLHPNTWGANAAIIAHYASTVEKTEELDLLSTLIESKKIPLYLKNSALHQICLAAKRDNRLAAAARGIIDLTFNLDPESPLAGTAMLADWYVIKNTMDASQAVEELRNKIWLTLQNKNAIEPNRFAALNILREQEALPEHKIDILKDLFAEAKSERNSTAILQIIFKLPAINREWVQTISPQSAEQEHLIWTFLSNRLSEEAAYNE